MTCCPVVNTLLKQSWELGAPGTAGLLRSRSEIPPPKALWVAFVMTLPGDRRCELVTTHCIPSAGPVLPKGRHQCVEKQHVLSPEVGSVKGLWAGWQGGHLTEVHGAQWEPWEVPRQGPCCSLGAPHVLQLTHRVPTTKCLGVSLESSTSGQRAAQVQVLLPAAAVPPPRADPPGTGRQWQCWPRPGAQSGSPSIAPSIGQEAGRACLPPDQPHLHPFLFHPSPWGEISGQGSGRSWAEGLLVSGWSPCRPGAGQQAVNRGQEGCWGVPPGYCWVLLEDHAVWFLTPLPQSRGGACSHGGGLRGLESKMGCPAEWDLPLFPVAPASRCSCTPTCIWV